MKKNFISTLCLLVVCFTVTAQTWDTYSDTWVAVDGLGRDVYSTTGVDKKTTINLNTNCKVGMFYYLWHGAHTDNGRPVFDVTELLKANLASPAWGKEGEMHWWGKPVLGYYRAGDEFVVAKHLQMLCDAGIDFLFFDATNALIYADVVEKIMLEIDRRIALGLKAPKLCFMVHSRALYTVEELYKRFYIYSVYDKYWFNYEGKPLILADKNEIYSTVFPKILERFTFRNSWAWMQGKTSGSWAWLEYYPQAWGWSNDQSVAEQISVSAAQHATTKVGKSYHNGKEPRLDAYALCDSTAYGLYFEEQWKQAHKIHPPILMITQFNEWTAQRFIVKTDGEKWTTRPGARESIGETSFVDTYNAEFNRDIEPSWHPLIRDNYYMQLCSHVRRYKGSRSVPVALMHKSIRLDRDMSQWTNVIPEYRDDPGDVLHQHTLGFNNMDTIDNVSGRNDIVQTKISEDKKNYYFYVRTQAPVTPCKTSKNWMMLFLNVDTDYKTGWEGYDYCVMKDTSGKYSLCVNSNNQYLWRPVMKVKFVVSACEMHFSLPKRLLSVKEGRFDFKWADNIPDSPDILDFIIQGDVAPNGRFNYRYQSK